jgi:hypothetical protein
LELGGGFPEHENGFGFELIKMAEVVGGHGRERMWNIERRTPKGRNPGAS